MTNVFGKITKSHMANLFVRAHGSSRQRFINHLSRHEPNAKRFFSKRTTSPSSKGPSDTNKCSESLDSSTRSESISRAVDNACDTAMTSSLKNRPENIVATSSKRCDESSTVDRIDSNVLRYSQSQLNDPCSRDCKISRSPVCCPDSCSKEETCPEPPPGICAPTAETVRKMRFWRYASLFGALPAVFLASVILGNRAKEEAKKPRPEFIPMDYMYIRTKRFPWGDGNHTLFHNPEKNAVPPDGYEVEDPNAVKGQ